MSTEPEEQISADEEFDETIVVAKPVDDATVVVTKPVDDATVVVVQPVDDETIVVAQPVDDATIVVARPVNDVTIVVAKPVDDETVVVASTRRARRDAETRSAGSAQKLAPAQDPASVHTPVAAQNQAAAQDLDVPDPAVPADATLDGAVDDAVAGAVDDATVVVAQPPQIEDVTIVVAQAPLQAQAPAQPQPQKSTRQRSSAWPGTSARSGTSAPPERSARPPRSAPADPEDDATRVVGRSAGRDPAPPVVEPEPEYSSAEFAKLMFKPPLDPRRRVKEAPFPQPEHTLPKRGVSQGMPVIFGARPEVLDGLSSANLDLGRRLGAVPASTVMTPARREGLPSMALLNRKFRVLALAGGAGVCIVVGLGLWGIAALAFG